MSEREATVRLLLQRVNQIATLVATRGVGERLVALTQTWYEP